MRWISFLVGIVVGVVCVWAGVTIYFYEGFAPVAAQAAPMPFETFYARAAMRAAVRSSAQQQSPLPADETNLMAGARVYRSDCAVCHSLPGLGKTDIESGEFPRPPQLLTGKGVTDDPVGRTHWVVAKGIRMSGMPSFEGTLSDDQIWQVSLLLANAHQLPAAVEELLKSPDPMIAGQDRQQAASHQ